MNIGFLEALKNGPWNCFIFHDVDLLPENPSNIYTCKKRPTHFSSAINKFNYSVPYEEYFGGVSAMLRSQFEKLNGFSNEFWGWGGEDDEIFLRIKAHKQKYYRLPTEIGRYEMVRHVRDKGNEA
uniref:Beta-1,4-N-acetylgalactosaminyltransferase bre-4 n=1 Tax=Panagrolaimus davidi TaxID=227884 RepID=A0A914PS34_9BILA